MAELLDASRGRRGRRGLPVASFAAEESFGAKWFLGCGGLRPKLIEGLHSRVEGGVLGGESRGGEALVVPG